VKAVSPSQNSTEIKAKGVTPSPTRHTIQSTTTPYNWGRLEKIDKKARTNTSNKRSTYHRPTAATWYKIERDSWGRLEQSLKEDKANSSTQAKHTSIVTVTYKRKRQRGRVRRTIEIRQSKAKQTANMQTSIVTVTYKRKRQMGPVRKTIEMRQRKANSTQAKQTRSIVTVTYERKRQREQVRNKGLKGDKANSTQAKQTRSKVTVPMQQETEGAG